MTTEIIVWAGIGIGVFAALWWGWGRKPPPNLP